MSVNLALMKKLITVISFALFSLTASYAQEDVTFCGVDFSEVRISGAKESPREFARAFDAMNELFLSQTEKYDVGRFTQLPIRETDLSAVLESQWQTCGEKLTAGKIADIVRAYPLTEQSGRGAVMIASELNKTEKIATYYFVTFDMTTREIETCVEISGRPGGFGLRNFWANSIHEALRSYKKAVKGKKDLKK